MSTWTMFAERLVCDHLAAFQPDTVLSLPPVILHTKVGTFLRQAESDLIARSGDLYPASQKISGSNIQMPSERDADHVIEWLVRSRQGELRQGMQLRYVGLISKVFSSYLCCNSAARIGIARLQACTPWTTQSLRTSMISSIVAPALSALRI